MYDGMKSINNEVIELPRMELSREPSPDRCPGRSDCGGRHTMPVIVPTRSNFMNCVIASSFLSLQGFPVSKLAQSLFCEQGT